MGWPYQVDVASLKQEVLGYLNEHPQAQDTLDGVLQWWLVRNRVTAGLNWLYTALEELEAEGWVCKVTGPDGQQWYRAASKGEGDRHAGDNTQTGDQ